MRAKEFITEREKLDEFIPLIAAGIWQLVQWGFAAYSGYMIYKTAKKYVDKTGGDPSKLTEDDYIDIALDVCIAVLLNKIPGGAAWIKRKFSKITPEEKAKVVGYVKPKVMDLFRSETAVGTAATTAAIAQGAKP